MPEMSRATITQLKALIWKNMLLRYRGEPLVIFEIGVPLLLGFACVVMMPGTNLPVNVFSPTEQHYFRPSSSSGIHMAYCPRSKLGDELMTYVRLVLNVSDSAVIGLDTVQECIDSVRERKTSHFFPVVILKRLDENAEMITKHLKFLIVDHNVFDTLEQKSDTAEAYLHYWHSKKNSTPVTLDIQVQSLPVPVNQNSAEAFMTIISLLIIFGVMPVSINMVKVITRERKSHLKESVNLLGASDWVYWLSWFMVGMLCSLVAMSFFFLTMYLGPAHAIIPDTSPLVSIMFLVVYAMNNLSFCFLTTVLLVKEGTGSYVLCMSAQIILFIFLGEFATSMPHVLQILLGMSVFQIGFCLGISAIITTEYIGEGYTLSNLFQSLPLSGQLNLPMSLSLMTVNTVFNMFCMWYFDKLQPSVYCDKQSHFFCFKRSYWSETEPQVPSFHQNVSSNDEFIQNNPPGLSVGVELLRLTKWSGQKLVVAETNLSLYNDQITVLLGPNGPDKSALIGMITGNTEPTYGTAIVCGYDVFRNSFKARRNIGLCPKYNILYQNLTCMENIKLYHQLQGLKTEEHEMMKVLIKAALSDKAYNKIVELKTCQKKRLSLTTALIGNPKVIIIDEPTEGLDLNEQRELWSFIKKCRRGKTILVTTINMNEAEALADRIAIMIDGLVKCYGSLSFLKQIYGVGYLLNLDKMTDCQEQEVTFAIQKIIPCACLLAENESELRYLLPLDSVSNFHRLLHTLEVNFYQLKILTFELYTTTLEDVFAKVERGYHLRPELVRDFRKRIEYKNLLSANSRGVVGSIDEASASSGVCSLSEISVRSTALNYRLLQPSTSVDPDKYGLSRSTKPATILNLPLSKSRLKMTLSSEDVFTNLEHRESGFASANTGHKSAYDMATGSVQVYKKEYTLEPEGGPSSTKLEAIIMKMLLLTRRNWVITLVQMLMPSVMLVLGISFSKHRSLEEHEPSTWFMLDDSSGSEVLVFASESSDFDLVTMYMSQVPAPHTPHLVFSDTSTESVTTHKNPTDDYMVKLLEQNGWAKYASNYLVGVDFSKKSARDGIAMSGFRIKHGAAISMQMLLNVHVKYLLGSEFTIQSGKFSVWRLQGDLLASSVTLALTSALTIFHITVVHSLITERENLAKNILEIYGVNYFLYWVSRFLCDMLTYSLIVLGLMAVFHLNKFIYIDGDRWFLTALFLFMFEAAFLPHTYVLQKLFYVPSKGSIIFLLTHIVTGVLGPFVVLTWKYSHADLGQLNKIVNLVSMLLELFNPFYSLSAFLLPFPTIVKILREEDSWSILDFFEVMTLQGIEVNMLRPLIVLICHSVLFIMLLFANETRLIEKMWNKKFGVYENIRKVQMNTGITDDDVEMERLLVNSLRLETLVNREVLIVQNLCKRYADFTAVDSLCFTVGLKSCFGLVGPTGSGKSTTLLMLAGIIPVTSGDAFIKGFSVRQSFDKARPFISFTPQCDILQPALTGRETLYFFGTLRGIPKKNLIKETEYLLQALRVESLADQVISTYGASKKRILSVAISLLGQPELILLDDPSSGLDPVERKVLWSVLKDAQAWPTAIILASSSVEECEAVCTKMAVQVMGRLKCVGTPEHLKLKFAIGYTAILYFRPDRKDQESYIQSLIVHMCSTFPGTAVYDKNRDNISFRIPGTNHKLSKIFRLLKHTKKAFGLENYVIHATSLEQVYLAFVRGSNVPHVKFVKKVKNVSWSESTRDVVSTIQNTISPRRWIRPKQRFAMKPMIHQ